LSYYLCHLYSRYQRLKKNSFSLPNGPTKLQDFLFHRYLREADYLMRRSVSIKSTSTEQSARTGHNKAEAGGMCHLDRLIFFHCPLIRFNINLFHGVYGYSLSRGAQKLNGRGINCLYQVFNFQIFWLLIKFSNFEDKLAVHS